MGRRPKILLADDVEFFIELERDFLKWTPADLLVCTDGREALEITRLEKPDLIYLDTDMPYLDGLTVCRAIKTDPYLSLTPIILIFPDKRSGNELIARKSGAAGQLGKPLERSAFLCLGRQHLFIIDRREHRYPLQTPVAFRIEGEEYQGVACDISSGGIFVHYRPPVLSDMPINLSFSLPHHATTIEVAGKISWVNQGSPRRHLSMPQGFGVQFQQISRDSVAQVSAYVDHHGGKMHRYAT